jgi:phasin family protein
VGTNDRADRERLAALTVTTPHLGLLDRLSPGCKPYSPSVPYFGCRRTSFNLKEVSMNSLQAVGLTFANTDLTKAWSIPKFPTLNVEALLEVHRKNVVALTKASQVVCDGLTTLARRERDLFKSTVDDYTKVTSDVLTETSVEERATKQVDVAGHIYASSVARFLELSDIAVKTNVSAVDILNARVTEGFDEFMALFAGRGAPTTATSAGPSITAEPIAVVEEVGPIGTAVAAVPSTATGTPRSAPRTARAAKAASKTSQRASKAASKTTARAAKAGRRRTLRN